MTSSLWIHEWKEDTYAIKMLCVRPQTTCTHACFLSVIVFSVFRDTVGQALLVDLRATSCVNSICTMQRMTQCNLLGSPAIWYMHLIRSEVYALATPTLPLRLLFETLVTDVRVPSKLGIDEGFSGSSFSFLFCFTLTSVTLCHFVTSSSVFLHAKTLNNKISRKSSAYWTNQAYLAQISTHVI